MFGSLYHNLLFIGIVYDIVWIFYVVLLFFLVFSFNYLDVSLKNLLLVIFYCVPKRPRFIF